MSPLRQRMLDALVLRGKAPRTQESYIDAVARLARHYRRSPETLTADEVQRYLLLLAPAGKTQRLALARQLLAMPQANPQAREDAQAFMRRVAGIEIECCPYCRHGRWRVVQELAADRGALSSIVPATCRGPP